MQLMNKLLRGWEILIKINVNLKLKNLWHTLWLFTFHIYSFSLFQEKLLFPYMRTSMWETLHFLWIISLVQLSHYIATALWWESYSTPTHLSFEPTGFVLDAPLSALLRSKSPQPVSAPLVSNYRGMMGECCKCACMCVSASMHKGLSCSHMPKRCQVCDYTSW